MLQLTVYLYFIENKIQLLQCDLEFKCDFLDKIDSRAQILVKKTQ